MHRTTRHLPSTCLILCAALLTTGCPEKVVVCPPGYVANGDYCYPEQQGGGGRTYPDAGLPVDICVGPACANPDATGAKDGAAPVDAGHDAGPAPDTKPSVDAGSKPDLGPVKPKSPIGAACQDDLDCVAGLTCFNWPKGYCTLLNCLTPGTTCPGSAICWGQSELSHLCNADCEQTSDCRAADGYGCKRLTAEFGGIDARMCLPSGKQAPGLTCTAPLDCAGTATCLTGKTGMEGGYCARIGCGKGDPCEAGTACVLRGKPTCLKECKADSDCAVPGAFPRKCVERSDMGKKTVMVCLDSNKAAAVGQQCNTDLDCESKSCTVVAKGTCKGGANAPCSVDEDCGANGPCVVDKDKEVGVCTQPCSNNAGCPIGSACVPGATDLTGSCQPICKGPGDVQTCAAVPGMACTFGQPIAPPGGTSVLTYACAPAVKGKAGAWCAKPEDCDSKKCSTNLQGTAGFCLASCDIGDAPCPFGTVCISGGISNCEKLCAVDYDCPPQMVCGNSGMASYKSCQIP